MKKRKNSSHDKRPKRKRKSNNNNINARDNSSSSELTAVPEEMVTDNNYYNSNHYYGLDLKILGNIASPEDTEMVDIGDNNYSNNNNNEYSNYNNNSNNNYNNNNYNNYNNKEDFDVDQFFNDNTSKKSDNNNNNYNNYNNEEEIPSPVKIQLLQPELKLNFKPHSSGIPTLKHSQPPQPNSQRQLVPLVGQIPLQQPKQILVYNNNNNTNSLQQQYGPYISEELYHQLLQHQKTLQVGASLPKFDANIQKNQQLHQYEKQEEIDEKYENKLEAILQRSLSSEYSDPFTNNSSSTKKKRSNVYGNLRNDDKYKIQVKLTEHKIKLTFDFKGYDYKFSSHSSVTNENYFWEIKVYYRNDGKGIKKYLWQKFSGNITKKKVKSNVTLVGPCPVTFSEGFYIAVVPTINGIRESKVLTEKIEFNWCSRSISAILTCLFKNLAFTCYPIYNSKKEYPLTSKFCLKLVYCIFQKSAEDIKLQYGEIIKYINDTKKLSYPIITLGLVTVLAKLQKLDNDEHRNVDTCLTGLLKSCGDYMSPKLVVDFFEKTPSHMSVLHKDYGDLFRANISFKDYSTQLNSLFQNQVKVKLKKIIKL